MSAFIRYLRTVLFFLGTALSMLLILIGIAWLMRPDIHAPPVAYDADELDRVLAARETKFDPKDLPVLHVDVDYREGEAAPWFPRHESPVLAELVAEGRLPPVAERTGPEPAVVEGPEGPGHYGGSWFRIANSDGDVGVMNGRIGGARLARWSPLGYPIKPLLARGWDVSEDRREYTVHLRRGARWSDGHPFTSRDFTYWWEQEVKYFGQNPQTMMVRGELGELEALDDYTVVFRFPHPNGLFPERMASAVFWVPAHYLERFHPEHGDPEARAEMMRVQGAPSERTAYFALKHPMNPELPQMNPWILRAHHDSAPFVFVRNPYYPVVDTEGRQLPYLDRVVNEVRSENVLSVSASAGDVTMQMRHIRFEDHALYMANRDRGNYDVLYWFRGERSNFVLSPNLNRRVDPDRPETRWKQAYLSKPEFRQALSLALNRKDMIRAEYDDIVEPAQIDPGPLSPFHHPPLYHAFTEYAPDRANSMLDAIGLDRRDREGYRTFPDGSRMTFFINITEFTGMGPVQFVVDDWAAVGVRAIIRFSARNLWQALQSSLEHDFSVWTGESEFYPVVEPRSFVPNSLHAFYAPGFALWFQRGGLFDPDSVPPGDRFVEPPADHPLRHSMELYLEALEAPDLESQVHTFRRVLQIAAENLWTINIATPSPQIVLVNRGLRNVSPIAITGFVFNTPFNTAPETYFLGEPDDNPQMREHLRRLMVEVDPNPRLTLSTEVAQQTTPARNDTLGRVIRRIFAGIGMLLVVLLVTRHPFIARRLITMIPTLVIISVIVFTIIELPPGDFITTRIQQLEMEGEETAIIQAMELRNLFHLEEPSWKRYIRWTGLPWFFTFDRANRGLLQGDLGLSMEDGRRVNDVVGDRILLTMLISACTILLTWAVAIPIGLYSAVRQYSFGDYFFTFLGFIGMCIPNMLLALVMMFLGSAVLGLPVGGLFSPEYAMQTHWNWPKFVNLLQHLWIPVFVIGLSGTAGMIRVLRANLLDELGKPYVTTARAKGVGPVKLVLKYPLRLALNPFISSIGNIFPALVSGGAIVGIVLSLPTVGPLLLNALRAQNMQLAGSMLMVLSLLTVLGTLFSDLLLMWVDPRIRMGGMEDKS